MTISTAKENSYPLYIKLNPLPNHKADPIRECLNKQAVLSPDRTVSCDNDPSFKWLRNVVTLKNDRVNYDDPDHKMFWLNIMASNFENAIKNIYRKVRKEDLPLFLAEQEYRTNHRYTGKHFFEKITKYIRKSKPVTNRRITEAVKSYEPDQFDQFVAEVM